MRMGSHLRSTYTDKAHATRSEEGIEKPTSWVPCRLWSTKHFTRHLRLWVTVNTTWHTQITYALTGYGTPHEVGACDTSHDVTRSCIAESIYNCCISKTWVKLYRYDLFKPINPLWKCHIEKKSPGTDGISHTVKYYCLKNSKQMANRQSLITHICFKEIYVDYAILGQQPYQL